MKKMKFFVGAFALVAMVFASCNNEGKNPPVVDPGDDSTEVVLEDMPLLDTPEAGYVTIAVRAPQGTCNGMIAVGAAINEDGSDDWGPGDKKHPFTLVEGTETWYQITLKANPGMTVKVIAVTDKGTADWPTQWGMNKEGEDPNVELLGTPGCAIDNTENGGEVKLVSFTDASLTYVDVKAWKSEPCVARNEAGTATWTLTVPATTPETAVVSVAGNWGVDGDPEYWIPGAVVMTRQEDGTYTLTKEVPAGFEYKYVVSADGVTWDWEYECSVSFVMPLSLKPVDVVEAWKSEPWATEETPAE